MADLAQSTTNGVKHLCEIVLRGGILMTMTSRVKKKFYYRKGDIVTIEEDSTHEFKGHRNLAVEDIPPWARETKTERASRKQVSRVLNAFLNTGKGGTVYLGVIDDGSVCGLRLTLYQKDHILGSIRDLFSRYKPSVPSHRCKVKFVPVLSQSCTEEEAQRFISQTQDDYCDTSQRHRQHMFRTPLYCWCDNDAVAQLNMGTLSPEYVIEIAIPPWDCEDRQHSGGVGSFVNLHPIHEDEEGNVYMRRQASVVKYTINEVAQLTRQQVKEACEGKIKKMKEEIARMKAEKYEVVS